MSDTNFWAARDRRRCLLRRKSLARNASIRVWSRTTERHRIRIQRVGGNNQSLRSVSDSREGQINILQAMVLHTYQWFILIQHQHKFRQCAILPGLFRCLTRLLYAGRRLCCRRGGDYGLSTRRFRTKCRVWRWYRVSEWAWSGLWIRHDVLTVAVLTVLSESELSEFKNMLYNCTFFFFKLVASSNVSDKISPLFFVLYDVWGIWLYAGAPPALQKINSATFGSWLLWWSSSACLTLFQSHYDKRH
jgi:hypothetical protein